MRYTILDTAFGAFGLVTDANRLFSAWLPRPESALRRLITRAPRSEKRNRHCSVLQISLPANLPTWRDLTSTPSGRLVGIRMFCLR